MHVRPPRPAGSGARCSTRCSASPSGRRSRPASSWLTERGLRFYDPRTGQELPDLDETDAARERERQGWQAAELRLAQEAAARRQEAAARAAAEARVAELEALLRRERGSDSG